MGGKIFAVLIVIIALASAVPIISHTFLGASVTPPEDISTHGKAIDDQLSVTMAEAGISFLAAQLVLGLFVWQFANRQAGTTKKLPGGATAMVIVAFLFVGAEVLALGLVGSKAWGMVYFKPAASDALQVQAQAGQFAFYFRYPGPDGKFGQIHPDKIDEGNSNFFGLDPENDIIARDDITSGELVVPVNKEINLMLLLAIIQAYLAVMFFMHLRDEKPTLRLALIPGTLFVLIMPIHRLNTAPDRQGTMVDIT